MIMTPTVLVLGAGASQPYGYPLGRELVKNIVRTVANQNSSLRKDLDQLLNPIRTTPAILYQHFKDALEASTSPSIDAFLESRSDFLLLGRYVIACELLRCENPERFYENEDWYHYLYDKMRDPHRFENFGESKISFITFNYDRSLEFFLFTALRNTFQKTAAECIENFKKIPIIHVHGVISRSPTDEVNWRYGKSNIPEAIKQSVEQIKIIHETTDDTDEFSSARHILSQAEKICFLGFGFHDTNLKRLFKGIKLLKSVKIFYSCFNLTDKERDDIHRRILAYTGFSNIHGNLIWGEREHGCYDFLRESGALLNVA